MNNMYNNIGIIIATIAFGIVGLSCLQTDATLYEKIAIMLGYVALGIYILTREDN